MPISYKDAGVDVESGYKAVELMKKHVAATHNKNVLGGLGSFGGFYSIADEKLAEPVLVSGTDGVGTKLKYAFIAGKHDTIGIDCVAMCANDVVCQGAKPLFFLDYFAVGKLDPYMAEQVVKGVADGCVLAGCALIGGETAEMPGFYKEGEYDIAGFCVGIVDKSKIINGNSIKAGDVLIGLGSSGIHSNGFSLVRKLFGEDLETLQNTFVGVSNASPQTVGAAQCAARGSHTVRPLLEEVLTPTRMYVKTILALKDKITLKGVAHMTGGGFIENIPRIFPSGVGAVVDTNSYPLPPVFQLLAEKSGLGKEQLYNTFNMGIGMVLCVDKKDAQAVLAEAQKLGEKAYIIGETVKGEGLELK